MCAGGSRGRLLFVEDGAADTISFGYVLSSSLGDENAPDYHVSIPVARERDFKKSRFQIVVPYGVGRVMLRVYEVNGRTDAAVRVLLRASIVGWAGAGRDTLEVPLSAREGTDPSYPAFAEVPLDLSCFYFSPRVCTQWHASVDIEPLVEGSTGRW